MPLSFAPTGFQYKRSLSNSSPEFNGVETFYWHVNFHGFSGDLIVSQIIYRKANFTETPANFVQAQLSLITAGTPWGKVAFPCPITSDDPLLTPTQNIPAENRPDGFIPLGIAQRFRYTPLGSNQEVTVLNFRAETPIQPGTLIYVDVITDPMAVYTVQTNSVYGYGPGWGANTYMPVGGQNYYLQTVNYDVVNGVQTAFVMGEFDGPTAGSRQYLFSPGAYDQNRSLTFISAEQNSIYNPTYSLGLTEGIIDNRFSYTGGTTYPYIYQDVKISNNVFSNGYTSAGTYPNNPVPIPTP